MKSTAYNDHRNIVRSGAALVVAIIAAFGLMTGARAQTINIDIDADATVSGSGGGTYSSPWNPTDTLRIGYSTDGSLTISNAGRVVSNAHGYIGYSSGITGEVTITGDGSKWTSSDQLHIGHDGIGKLGIFNKGNLTTDSFTRVGERAGSHGTILVTDNASWNAEKDIYVGLAGRGEVTVSGGGSITSNSHFIIGDNASGKGTVTVTGDGSKWESSKNAYVGSSGSAQMTISKKGAVSNGEGHIGSSASPDSSVKVTDSGSTWTNNGTLYVGSGYDSNARLTISDGGEVSNTAGYLGAYYQTASGTVMVTGGNSKWINNDNLYVGQSGSGELTISNGGTVSATGVLLTHLSDSSSTGTINIGAETSDAPVAPGTLNAPTLSFRSGTGTLVFNHTGSDYLFLPPISGANTASKLNVLAGVTTLDGLNDYAGTTTVSGGTLRAGVANNGSAGAFSPNSDFAVVSSDATLDANGLDQTIASLSNGGTVRVAPNGATSTALTVTGEYIGGGTLAVDARLGDDSSPTGRLVIEGSVSGTTMIDVTALAGSSGGQTGTGIVLVRMVGKASDDALDGAFTLASSPLVAGNYEYTLFAVDDNGDKLFVLKSGPRAGGGGATAIPMLPLPLLLALGAAVGLLGRRRLRPGV